MSKNRPKTKKSKSTLRESSHSTSLEWARRHPGIVRIAGALALTSVLFGSGGGVDKMADVIISPIGTINSVAEQSMQPTPGPNEEIDGIAFKDYPIDTQDEWKTRINEHNENLKNAAGRLASTMQNLDVHDSEGILLDAQRYLDENSAEYEYQTEHRDEVVRGIEEADELDEVITQANTYLHSAYNLEFRFTTEDTESKNILAIEEDDIELKGAKEVAIGAIASLYVFPKSLITSAGLEAIQVGKGRTVYIGGEYSDHKKIIAFPLAAGLGKALESLDGLEAGADMSTEGRVAHELAHAFAYSQDYDLMRTLGIASPYNEGANNSGNALLFYFSRAINFPTEVSTYATTDKADQDSESFSGATTGRKDGLAHPDEVRRFGSPANKKMLSIITGLEQLYPGISNLIVLDNERLLNRSPIRLFR